MSDTMIRFAGSTYSAPTVDRDGTRWYQVFEPDGDRYVTKAPPREVRNHFATCKRHQR